MKEVIYLAADKYGVKRMTKNLPQLNRGEIPIKLIIEVDEAAFREPVITKEVVIEDWREGIDLADVEFKEGVITPEEAEMIKAQRLQKMEDIMRAQGYQIIKPTDQQ